MYYKIGNIELSYDPDVLAGSVSNRNKTWRGTNVFELLNIFMNEIDHSLRTDVRRRLDGTGINIWTGMPEEKKEK